MAVGGRGWYFTAMRAHVRVRVDSGPPGTPGETVVLASGDMIGRTWGAALRLDDPQISEAHALVSLRGDVLKLLALRGRFVVDDKPLSELELAAGQRVRLAKDIVLEVLEVVVPSEVLALEGDGLARQVLGGVCSLRVAPRPEIVPGFAGDADAVFWSDGGEWTMRLRGQASGDDTPLVSGDVFAIDGRRFQAVAVPLDSGPQTVGWDVLEAPLVLVVRYDTVHIHREIASSIALDGISARILSELATIALPVAWQSVANEIWPDEDDVLALRRKWDTSLARLRKKLRDSRIRQDLVRADGNGNFEIFLRATDRVDDQT